MATCCRDVRGLGGPGTDVLRGEMVPLGVSIEERCKRRESGIESLLYAAGVHSSSQAGKKKNGSPANRLSHGEPERSEGTCTVTDADVL